MKKIMKKVKAFFASEQGDVSVKGIAIMVAVIVIIGFGITIIKGNLSGWIDQIWEMATDAIEGFM